LLSRRYVGPRQGDNSYHRELCLVTYKSPPTSTIFVVLHPSSTSLQFFLLPVCDHNSFVQLSFQHVAQVAIQLVGCPAFPTLSHEHDLKPCLFQANRSSASACSVYSPQFTAMASSPAPPHACQDLSLALLAVVRCCRSRHQIAMATSRARCRFSAPTSIPLLAIFGFARASNSPTMAPTSIASLLGRLCQWKSRSEHHILAQQTSPSSTLLLTLSLDPH
jgi:hypothetical protein